MNPKLRGSLILLVGLLLVGFLAVKLAVHIAIKLVIIAVFAVVVLYLGHLGSKPWGLSDSLSGPVDSESETR